MTEFSQPVSLSTLTHHESLNSPLTQTLFFLSKYFLLWLFEFMDAGALVKKSVFIYLASPALNRLCSQGRIWTPDPPAPPPECCVYIVMHTMTTGLCRTGDQ